MHLDTFVSASFRGLNLSALASNYAEWVLGLGSTTKKRRTRIELGVDERWRVEDVREGNALVGDHGCRAEMRLTESQMLLRFVHRDWREGAVLWHTVARATCRDDVVVVEHGVGRDAPRDYALYPIASPPHLIGALIDRAGIEVRPRELTVDLITLREGEVDRFVDHEIVNARRAASLLVVSCGRGGTPPVVDPARLAQSLRGIAGVVFLATQQATFEFGTALAQRGFGPEFRCFNGAAHLYGPASEMRIDHRLWLAETLAIGPADHRPARLAGLVARRLAVRNIPRGFFTSVDDHDRDERRRLAEALSRRPSTPPEVSSTLSSETDTARQFTEDAERLREELRASIQREDETLEKWNTADDDRRSAEQERDDAEAQLEQERLVSADLRDQLELAKRAERPALSATITEAIQRTLSRRMTPHACLTLLALAYPNRVCVLESAYQSAQHSEGFLHTDKLAEQLHILATNYYDALIAGNQVAAKVFGKTLAAKESETTMSNKRAIEERRFTYNGRSILMWSHLRIGVKESVAETIRVHFEWLADEKKLIVGWCGEHRYRRG